MPAETRHYVPKLQALKNIIANPALFGIDLDPIPNQPYFASVTKTRDIDVRLAAQLAEMTGRGIRRAEPGLQPPGDPRRAHAAHRAAGGPRRRVPREPHQVRRQVAGVLADLPAEEGRQPGGHRQDGSASAWRSSRKSTASRRARAPCPRVLVVPTGPHGGARDLGRLPIMYAPPIPLAGPRTFVHTVKTGETLPGIAARYRVSGRRPAALEQDRPPDGRAEAHGADQGHPLGGEKGAGEGKAKAGLTRTDLSRNHEVVVIKFM